MTTSNIPQTSVFDKVRDLLFPDVLRVFLPGAELKRGKICCPFHQERTPSFHVYPDGFRCYGCGAAGDAVGLVARLEGLKPLDAARRIAAAFNIPTDRPPTRAERQELTEARRQRELRQKYLELERRAFLAAAAFRDLAAGVFEADGLDLADDLVPAVQLLPLVEHYLEILSAGEDSERTELLREGVITKWAKLWSFQQRTGRCLKISA